jgi:F-type H+-transporting ATPase subunit b
MLIDWFTVTAQAINFLVLVWFLKRFLYAPVLRAISEREQRVAAQLREAEEKKAEARREQEDFERKNQEFDRQRAELLQKAENEAGAKRTALMDEARTEAEAFRARLQQTIRDERDSLNRQITDRTQHEIFAIARKVLADLANAPLEERMAALFIGRLAGIPADEKKAVASQLVSSPRPILVRSAFALPPVQRTGILQAVHEAFGAVPGVEFETSPDVVSGIELLTGGHKIAWSIAEYLRSLEQAMDSVLGKSNADEPT